MLQIGLTGKLFIKRLELYDDDILVLVKNGLQPYGEYWKAILPPGREDMPLEIAVLMRKKAVIEGQYPGILNSSCDYTFVKREIDSKGKIKNIRYPDGTTNRIRFRYEMLTAKIDKLQKKCSWKKFIIPQNKEEKEEIKKTLLNARYKMEDFLALEKAIKKKEPTKKITGDEIASDTQDIPPPNTTLPTEEKSNILDPESFIRSLQVSYLSDTEVNIKVDKQRSKKYHHKALGFKRENTKGWRAFIQILKSADHLYHVGQAHGKGYERNKQYDANQNRLREISKKIVSFLKEAYKQQLPDNLQIFDLKKNDRPGTYEPKFIISKFGTDDVYYNSYSKAELIEEIEKLSELKGELEDRGDEDSESRICQITEKLNSAIAIATEKKYLDRHRAESYLNPTKN